MSAIAATLPSPVSSVGLTSGIVNPSPSPKSLVVNRNALLREFLKAQNTELKAVDHQQKFEMKELKASQDAREKDWNKAEKEARHQFFESHPKGSERREYVQAFIRRRDELHKRYNDERNQKKKEQEAKVAALRKEQSERLKVFKESLEKGASPRPDLWPSGL